MSVRFYKRDGRYTNTLTLEQISIRERGIWVVCTGGGTMGTRLLGDAMIDCWWANR